MSSFCSSRELLLNISDFVWQVKFGNVKINRNVLSLKERLLGFFNSGVMELQKMYKNFQIGSLRSCYFTGQQHIEYNHTTFSPEI